MCCLQRFAINSSAYSTIRRIRMMHVLSRITDMTLSTALLTARHGQHDIVNKYNHECNMMLWNNSTLIWDTSTSTAMPKAYQITIMKAQLKKVFTDGADAREGRCGRSGTARRPHTAVGADPSLTSPAGAAGCKSSFGHASELLPRSSVAYIGDCELMGRH